MTSQHPRTSLSHGIEEHLLKDLMPSALGGKPALIAASPISLGTSASTHPGKKLSGVEQRKFKSLGVVWLYEAVACVLALLSLLAINIFLSQYDGKPKPQWPYELTPNTIVSIFSLILKTCLLLATSECISQSKWSWFRSPQRLRDFDVFDRASRGLTGSFHLLYDVKFRQVAALGAVITIFSIGIDPFVQQSVQYSTDRVNTTSIASVPITRNYSNPISSVVPLDEAMLGAIVDGVLNPTGANLKIEAKCPTADCDFSIPYQSLGWCSRCSNMSPQIKGTLRNFTVQLHNDPNPLSSRNLEMKPTSQVTINQANESLFLNATYGLSDDRRNGTISFFQGMESSAKIPVSAFNMSRWHELPPTLSIPPSPEIGASGDNASWYGALLLMGVTTGACTTEWMDGGRMFTDTDCFQVSRLNNSLNPLGPTMSSCEQVKVKNGTEKLVIAHKNPTFESWPNITAASCRTGPCIKTYVGSVISGTLSETLVRESNVLAVGEAHPSTENTTSWRLIPMNCLLDGQKYELSDFVDVQRFMQSGGWELDYDAFQAYVTEPDILEKCALTISAAVDIAMQTSFDDYLRVGGKATFDPIGFKRDDLGTQPILDPWNPPGQVRFPAGGLLSPLFASGNMSTYNLNQTFQNIAMAITNHMRMTDLHQDSISGIAYTSETLVHVNFAWLVLPTLLVVAGCLFLGLVITEIHNTSSDMLWKSSQTALLYHGLQDRDELGRLSLTKDMKTTSKAVQVQLGNEAAGWRLVPTEQLAMEDDRENFEVSPIVS